MDENRQDKTESVLPATEDKLWLPPLSPKDQERLDHLRKKRTKANNERLGFSGKSVWDWLNLFGVLAIPFVVTIVGLYLTQQITQQQAQLSDAANKQQHQIDLQIALDQQREATLKTYLDDMSDLLLNHGLDTSQPTKEVRQVARERTLTTLRRLDATRNGIVVQFLRDASLIGVKNAVVDLSNGDLSHDDLREVNLSGVNLSGAGLYGTDLSNADLTGANLSNADLYGFDPSNADLNNADLSGAQLDGADLRYARVTGKQLAQARSLKGAIMPDGSIHP